MSTTQPSSRYDELLKIYLPAIHQAARSVQTDHCQNSSLEDLLMAGFQGFKEAFHQHPLLETTGRQSIYSKRIYASMIQQINGQLKPAHSN